MELLTGSDEKYGSRKNGYANILTIILLTISTMQVFSRGE